MDMDFGYDTCSSPSQSLIPKKHKQDQYLLPTNLGVSPSVSVAVANKNLVNSFTSGSNYGDQNGSTSDMSYHNDSNDVDANGDSDYYHDEVASDYGDDDEYLDDVGDGDYLKLQAQYVNVDLPPGVEVTVSWLQEPSIEEKSSAAGSSTSNKGDISDCASSSKAESSSKIIKEETMDDVLRKLMYFKQFDTVDDFSDHHYMDMESSGRQPSKSWTKIIQDEWKILEQNLPETIYVRVYETRMDLLRAVIIGPAGTPYHDGLFVFDAVFPQSYPNDPPMVHYHSSGFRMNPNLYECGKVCLSLLNTWHGGSQETCLPDKSTMLKVLVSMQALILNTEPFFNEPGYEKSFQGPEGKLKSRKYSEDIYLKSSKKIMCTLRNPPQHFKDLVAGHFRVRALDILTACQAYAEGAEIACDIKKWREMGDSAPKCGSPGFKAEAAKMMNRLLKYFIINGSRDLDKFQK